MHLPARALTVKLLLSTAAAATLLLAPATALATESAPTSSRVAVSAVAEPPPGSPIPIGPAVYPGDPVAARFLGDDVRVRSYPDTRDGRIVSVGQRFHRVDAHCYRVMRTAAARGNATWIYVSHRQASGDDQRGWVNSRYLAYRANIDRCSPGV